MSIRILADQYLYHTGDMIPDQSELTLFDPENGFPGNATEFDALLIRTVTKINSDTLPKAGNLRFIGTATAGFDHVDRDHLENLDIRFGYSPGCNARAVAEYVITGILRWAESRRREPSTLSVGVVGCGHTGTEVIHLLKDFSIPFTGYDPPKEQVNPSFISASLDELLACDILTFHTPLTFEGLHSTVHLCSDEWLAQPFQLVINAARGGVVDESALLDAMHHGRVRDCIIDVWENEPVFSDTLAETALIATPHIAGYSREAKIKATRMVVDQMCTYFGLIPGSNSVSDIPEIPEISGSDSKSLAGFLWHLNRIDLYDHDFRKLIGTPDSKKARAFALLRASTPARFEYAGIIRTLKERGEPIPEGADIFLLNP